MKTNYPPEAVAQINELQEQNRIMRQLATSTGFYDYYFKQLKHHPTNVECFNAINDQYFEIFGEYKYASYHSFVTSHRRKLNK